MTSNHIRHEEVAQEVHLVASTPNEIAIWRLASLRGKIGLEAKGMKCRGRSTRSRIAEEFGLKSRDPHEKFIAAINEKIESLRHEINKSRSVEESQH